MITLCIIPDCSRGAGKEPEYVKIVRCKDCMYYHSDNGYTFMCDIQQFVTPSSRKPDDYCSYGERRTE